MLIQLASAPVLASLCCLYIKDRYEKEPWRMLFWSLLYGLYATFVIYGFGSWLEATFPHGETPAFTAFVSSAGVEESIKLLFLFFLVFYNRQFNEPMDGAVYGGFVSLGFAWLENLTYVFHPSLGGVDTALVRAVLSVPCHGLFGVEMGYWLAKTKFEGRRYLPMAFFAPYICHGVYNYLLFLEKGWALALFGLWVAFLWGLALVRIRYLLARSPFR